ncbi:MAG: septum formation inhibitor Maf, partial [Candidatus Dadabacteria bacterium]|nr:septum formation inhibitor Maf [Candidatus Dadabacteria bacterium]
MLESLGIEFDVKEPEVDETHLENESPREFVLRLSKEKAANVSNI